MSELKLAQPMILNDFKKAYPRALAYKQSHRFLSGVPDLRMAHVKAGEWNIEVKYEPHMPKGVKSVGLDMTELQRQWGKRARESGMNWGWALVVRDGYKGYWIKGGLDYDQKSVLIYDITESNCYRRHGQGWEAYDLIQQYRALAK